jgi:hypothetical protein
MLVKPTLYITFVLELICAILANLRMAFDCKFALDIIRFVNLSYSHVSIILEEATECLHQTGQIRRRCPHLSVISSQPCNADFDIWS